MTRKLGRRAAVAAAVVAVCAVMPSSALAGRGTVKNIGAGSSGGGTTNPAGLCLNMTIPGVTKPISFTIGNLQFSYDPNGTCPSGSGGGTTGGATG